KGPNAFSKLVGTLASGAAVAGGLFAGSMFIVSNEAETNSQPDSLGDPAFADSTQSTQSVNSSAASSASNFSGAVGGKFTTAIKSGAGVAPLLPVQPAIVAVGQLDFGTTSSATQASGSYGSGSGNTTNTTQAGGSSGSGGGNTTNSTQAGSGKGEYESGDDSGDREDGGERGD
ncbi:MAG: hypothetical protein WCO24_04480, partial [Actinomycetes bacterium]